ncbi:MAG: hypothetical protein LEGION0398_MBIBDBAK_00663 [Legionellaceae bacterium]
MVSNTNTDLAKTAKRLSYYCDFTIKNIERLKILIQRYEISNNISEIKNVSDKTNTSNDDNSDNNQHLNESESNPEQLQDSNAINNRLNNLLEIFDKLNPKPYYTLSNLTPEEINQLKDQVRGNSPKVESLKIENNLYKTVFFTYTELKQLERKLTESIELTKKEQANPSLEDEIKNNQLVALEAILAKLKSSIKSNSKQILSEYSLNRSEEIVQEINKIDKKISVKPPSVQNLALNSTSYKTIHLNSYKHSIDDFDLFLTTLSSLIERIKNASENSGNTFDFINSELRELKGLAQDKFKNNNFFQILQLSTHQNNENKRLFFKLFLGISAILTLGASLVIKGLYTRAKTGQFSIFEDKTNRQLLAKSIHESTDKVMETWQSYLINIKI